MSIPVIHTMPTSVIVSRIQNRRGAQIDFNGFAFSVLGPHSVYPAGYTGIGGYNSYPNFNSTNYPNVLLPGELALCTDSRKIFLGNLNGEYLELAGMSSSGELFSPSSWVLPPSSTYTTITNMIPGPTTVTLDFDLTPFFNIVYSITDSNSPDWNALGNNFSKNGELKITAVRGGVIPAVTLTDTGTEINMLLPSDISFIATSDGSKISIEYMHDFPGNLMFSTSSLTWIPF